jgi:uncharacterized membrane protein YqjE
MVVFRVSVWLLAARGLARMTAGCCVFGIVVIWLLVVIALWEKTRRWRPSTSDDLEALPFVLSLALEHVAEPTRGRRDRTCGICRTRLQLASASMREWRAANTIIEIHFTHSIVLSLPRIL